MKARIAIAAIVAALATGAAVPASTAYRTIYRGQGIWCTSSSSGIQCVRTDGMGYGVGFSRDAVLIMRFDADGSSHRIYSRYQP